MQYINVMEDPLHYTPQEDKESRLILIYELAQTRTLILNSLKAILLRFNETRHMIHPDLIACKPGHKHKCFFD